MNTFDQFFKKSIVGLVLQRQNMRFPFVENN
jgi:hypothetical protein